MEDQVRVTRSHPWSHRRVEHFKHSCAWSWGFQAQVARKTPVRGNRNNHRAQQSSLLIIHLIQPVKKHQGRIQALCETSLRAELQLVGPEPGTNDQDSPQECHRTPDQRAARIEGYGRLHQLDHQCYRQQTECVRHNHQLLADRSHHFRL